MNDRSPLHHFVRITRNFGFIIAMRVVYSKLRGALCPALALPDAVLLVAKKRELSILLSSDDQSAVNLGSLVEVLARRVNLDWEICICVRFPITLEITSIISRFRGTQPWIRIVTADESVDDVTAARWTVEQATGQFVAVLAPEYIPDEGAIAALLALLYKACGCDAAALIETNGGSSNPPSRHLWADCRLLLQRKSRYLATVHGSWPLTAPALAKHLDEARVPTVYVAGQSLNEVLD